MTKLSELRAKHKKTLQQVTIDLDNAGFKTTISTVRRAEMTGRVKWPLALALANYYKIKTADVME